MITIYDLLEVKEDASKEEIEQSYFNLVKEYRIDPNFSEEKNNDNKIILEKLKLAYNILTNDEKRRRYDIDLAKKRAEDLIRNVEVVPVEKQVEPIKELPKEDNNMPQNIEENSIKKNLKKEVKYEEDEVEYEKDSLENNIEDDVELAEAEKKKIKKAAQKEFQKNLKLAKKAEEEYQKAYNEAYNDYLRKMGFVVEEPWTFSRIRRLIIGLLIIVGICILIWMLPPTRALLIQLYEENFIIKTLVDITAKFINIIINIFK